jgi:hypothetical protein
MEIKYTRNIRLVVCPDEQHIVGCDDKGKIRRWNVTNGMETGVPMNGGANVLLHLSVKRRKVDRKCHGRVGAE